MQEYGGFLARKCFSGAPTRSRGRRPLAVYRPCECLTAKADVKRGLKKKKPGLSTVPADGKRCSTKRTKNKSQSQNPNFAPGPDRHHLALPELQLEPAGLGTKGGEPGFRAGGQGLGFRGLGFRVQGAYDFWGLRGLGSFGFRVGLGR